MGKFQIDAQTQIWIAVGVAVMSAIAQGQVKFPMGISPEISAAIVSWDNFLLGIYLIANPILLGFSSSHPGPLAPPDPPEVKAATIEAAKKG